MSAGILPDKCPEWYTPKPQGLPTPQGPLGPPVSGACRTTLPGRPPLPWLQAPGQKPRRPPCQPPPPRTCPGASRRGPSLSTTTWPPTSIAHKLGWASCTGPKALASPREVHLPQWKQFPASPSGSWLEWLLPNSVVDPSEHDVHQETSDPTQSRRPCLPLPADQTPGWHAPQLSLQAAKKKTNTSIKQKHLGLWCQKEPAPTVPELRAPQSTGTAPQPRQEATASPGPSAGKHLTAASPEPTALRFPSAGVPASRTAGTELPTVTRDLKVILRTDLLPPPSLTRGVHSLRRPQDQAKGRMWPRGWARGGKGQRGRTLPMVPGPAGRGQSRGPG